MEITVVENQCIRTDTGDIVLRPNSLGEDYKMKQLLKLFEHLTEKDINYLLELKEIS